MLDRFVCCSSQLCGHRSNSITRTPSIQIYQAFFPYTNSKKKNDVKVCRGGTLTSPVDLVKCLLAIKDNAFVASEYPVAITLEDHLTSNLQAQVAQGQVDDDEFIEEVNEEKAAPEYRNLIAVHAMKLKGRLYNIFQDIVRNKARRLSMSEQHFENAVTKNHGTVIVRCLELKVEDDDGGRRLQLTIEGCLTQPKLWLSKMFQHVKRYRFVVFEVFLLLLLCCYELNCVVMMLL
ncbi:hypothetical protein Ddye_006036 [Dipteronia dyeriana]|uniref:Phosphatidylinositol-specific phospholipase C X domain-containing protein n=1 Tax=Dipteronia dyeriana TaxID=168575 RepID=A0AAE0CQT4_9ROSI|nr:hypothetical protein Ddye_006036 [Dipteronia dyeriana]